MGDKLKFNDDDHGGLYEPTDSEDNYSEEEKELLQKVRQGNRRKQDPKQEMFAFDESDDDDDDDNNEDTEDDDDVGKLMADSDIEGAEDDDADIPDRRAWGSRSRNFYNTDFVDPDYSSYNDQERELALAEEEEALAIQKRLALEMKEENFVFDMFSNVTSPSTKDRNNDSDDNEKMPKQLITTKPKQDTGVTKFTLSLDGLSKREKLEIFYKNSPEFFGLVDDLHMGLNECGNLLTPIINYAKTHKLPNIPALEFAEVMNTLLTTYCSNINFYLILKANRVSIKTHPITNRLLQLKDMLERLSDRYENIIKPQLEALLERIEDGDVFEVLVPEQTSKKAPPSKRIKSSNQSDDVGSPEKDLKSDDACTEDDENAMAELANEEEERRGITYQISKNKGLTPHRKKELRNPRVKHRSKFRKALVRRKGAVRTVRTETKRYGGEVSGIKATVSKSVKFK